MTSDPVRELTYDSLFAAVGLSIKEPWRVIDWISLIDHISTSTEDSLYTSMEALNNGSFGGHQNNNNNRRNQNRVKVLPDLNEQPTKPSRTNPNVVNNLPSHPGLT